MYFLLKAVQTQTLNFKPGIDLQRTNNNIHKIQLWRQKQTDLFKEKLRNTNNCVFIYFIHHL